MRAAELRGRYLQFFSDRDHRVVPSSPLVPNDPTLLFTSAGMVQFKDVFWGRTEPGYARATTCQKCFRTTDIENVGRTAYHHTFFEMLGNFSFGDYFKERAIDLAWAFLTEELGVPAERLSASVFEDDEEAYGIWRDRIGLPADRIVRLGRAHNWWGPVGESGPCGPDSEIHYDTGGENACGPGCTGVACDCNRFSEIWNLVFMEYDAQLDGSYHPLARPSIDTGMGLERTAAALQSVGSNFDIDLFRPITEAIEAAARTGSSQQAVFHRNTIADHVRGVLFLVADGVLPGNEKQGYVLRRILRRAIRAGEKLEIAPGALSSFLAPVVEALGATYPEIVEACEVAARLVNREETQFRRVLQDGERRLERILAGLAAAGDSVLPGDLAFELTDTYGFPLEMTEEISAEVGVRVDREGFETALSAQRQRSRASAGGGIGADAPEAPVLKEVPPSVFVGHERLAIESALSAVLGSGEGMAVAAKETPFYAAGGGQAADTGRIENLSRPGSAAVVDVRHAGDGIVHAIRVERGTFEIGDRCRLIVDEGRRARIARNHTATHLLHAGLREVLGPHVHQAGSEVSESELRFDFSHFEQLSDSQIEAVEDRIVRAILSDYPVTIDEVTLDDARRSGAIGLFEDVYRGRERVRIVAIDDVSRELCGGTHVRRSGEIGLFRVVSEESIASGVRRIRGVTGDAVLARLRDRERHLAALRERLGDDPLVGVDRLRAEVETLRTDLRSLSAERARAKARQLLANAERIGGASLVAARVDGDADLLKELADRLEESARPAVVLLVGEAGGRGLVVCKRSEGIDAVDAGALVREIARELGGGGGGNHSFAQGGGPGANRLDAQLRCGLDSARAALSSSFPTNG